MTSLEYWKERERAAAEEYAVQDEEALRRTQDVYLRLMASINDRINAFYARYAASEGITMNLAEQAVSQFDVKAFEATAAKMVADKDFSPQANAQLKIYNATMRINRLEMLKAYIGLDTIAAGEELVQLDESYLTERCREEFERQAGILGESIRPTRKDVDAIVHSSFYNATFSQRIWANMSELHDELSTILTNGIIQGINPREMTSRLTERFQVSESDAERLLRTEMARVQTETQRQSFQMAGFEYYVFISLEGRACPVCAALDTGEPIPLEDFMPGETAPPVHPNCRCSVAAWMDREQMEKELGFALDEEEAAPEAAVEAFKPAADMKEVKTRAADALGVDESVVNFGRMKLELANQYLDGIETFMRDFPEMKGLYTEVNTKRCRGGTLGINSLEGVGYRSSLGGIRYKITFALGLKSPADMAAFEAMYRMGIETKQHYEGADPRATAIHELTHGLMHAISMKNNGYFDNGTLKIDIDKGSWDNYTTTTSHTLVKTVKQNLFGAERGRNVYNGMEYLGSYALTNSEETIAESVSYEYTNPDKSQEFSRTILESVREQVKEAFHA